MIDPSIESDPTRTLGFVFGKLVMKHRLAERSVPEVVRARGVEPSAVSRVLVTYLHLDHASASGQWPHATFIVDRVERAPADGQRGPGPYIRRPHRFAETDLVRVRDGQRQIDGQ
jgi:glyoxylase-like metal-dependent hydrolase (beta-lactamase superfamily II)